MTGRQKNGKAALAAGTLGEHAARKYLGLSEPQVEIKTMQKERHKFSVELTQLERQIDKLYLIVVYSRGSYRSKGKRRNEKRTWEKTIKQAFANSLEFVLVPAERLIELVKEGAFQVRYCTHIGHTGARFVATFRLDRVKDETHCQSLESKHFIYATQELIERL